MATIPSYSSKVFEVTKDLTLFQYIPISGETTSERRTTRRYTPYCNKLILNTHTEDFEASDPLQVARAVNLNLTVL